MKFLLPAIFLVVLSVTSFALFSSYKSFSLEGYSTEFERDSNNKIKKILKSLKDEHYQKELEKGYDIDVVEAKSQVFIAFRYPESTRNKKNLSEHPLNNIFIRTITRAEVLSTPGYPEEKELNFSYKLYPIAISEY